MFFFDIVINLMRNDETYFATIVLYRCTTLLHIVQYMSYFIGYNIMSLQITSFQPYMLQYTNNVNEYVVNGCNIVQFSKYVMYC